jgi:Arc/MetJ-type ribon-helix-helix transcriptional regulator
MSYVFPPEIDQLMRLRMATGKYRSEDELLRDALVALAEQEDDLAAVQDALAELAAGDVGQPLDEAFCEIRQRIQQQSGA